MSLAEEMGDLAPEPSQLQLLEGVTSLSLTEEEFALRFFFDYECGDVAFGD